MYAHNLIILAVMRMGIVLGRLSVGCPARMSNTAAPLHRLAVIRLIGQLLQPSLGLDYPYLVLAVPHCDPGRIIASVFKLRKSFQKYRSCLLITAISYYSAHIMSSVSCHMMAFLMPQSVLYSAK